MLGSICLTSNAASGSVRCAVGAGAGVAKATPGGHRQTWRPVMEGSLALDASFGIAWSSEFA